MSVTTRSWQKLLLFCSGLFLAAAFCMKWMEPDFVSAGAPFSIIGLEVSYPAEKVMAVLTGLDDRVRTILQYHLHFDFVFMAGVYPGIAALCAWAARRRTPSMFRNLLLTMAALQIVAWGCDIAENSYLLNWIKHPQSITDFGRYHLVVFTKWILALLGVVLALLGFVWPQRKTGHAA